jgi:hypothetical protein
MAFATNTLVNGEWTTRTVDVDAVLRHYNQQDQDASSSVVEVQKPPVLGLLTQTAIKSPLVHWIFPCKLRGSKVNDVAFIGVGELSLLCIDLSASSLTLILHPQWAAAIAVSSCFPPLAPQASLHRDKPATL